MRDKSGNAQRILFVCAGNTCRSPMAAALARRLFDASSRLESAGTGATDGAPATPDAVQVMKEHGLDIGNHKSGNVSRVNLRDFDVVVALTPSIAQNLRRLGIDDSKLKTLSVPDPIGQGIESYRRTAIAIGRGLSSLFGSDQRPTPGE